MPAHQIKQRKREIIERHARSDDLSAWTQVFTTILPYGLLWWLAIWTATHSWWFTAVLIVPISLVTLRLLVLMHECGHGSLFRTPHLNRALGFVFGVLTGMPQYVWSQHHDFHHAHNGDWQSYRGPLTSPSVDEYAAMTTAQRRAYRWTRSVAVAPLGGFVYLLFNPRFTWMKGSIALLIHIIRGKLSEPRLPLRSLAASFKARYWKSPKEYWHMTCNNIVLLCLLVVMCSAIGAPLFFFIYVISVSLAGGAGIALFTVQHNFEHAYATDKARWDYDTGAMEGTSFLVLPGWLNWFTANIGYHHVHHLSAKIPNYRLKRCHEENREVFAGVKRVKLSEIYRSLRCLLWDARAQRIISFEEFDRQLERPKPI
jgi:acyl-lipid omega-6 desaturase (Delta-12 desaturase)